MTHTLIIDDLQSDIDVLAILLEHEGLTCSSTTRAEQIDNALQTGGTPDIIFLDLELVNTTGLIMLPILRQYDQLTHTRIIAYSVHTSEIGMVQRAGFDGFLGKPLDPVHFPHILSDMLAGRPVWIA